MAGISISELKEKLKGLSSFGTPLSELEKLSDHQPLLSTDFFTIARQAARNTYTGQDHKNLNLKYATISTNLLDKFRNDDITTSGVWSFGEFTTSRIYFKSVPENIDPWDKLVPQMNADNFGAITIDYYNNNLAKMVEDLSTMYYNCTDPSFRLASNIGDVLTNTKPSLNGYTIGGGSWELIRNMNGNTMAQGNYVMIIGAGPCEANNYTKNGDTQAGAVNLNRGDTGGSYTTVLTHAQFPDHKHGFKADNVSFWMTFKLRGTIAPIASKFDEAVTLSMHKNESSEGNKDAHTAKMGMVKPFKMTGSGSLSSTKWKGTLSMADVICDSSGAIIPDATIWSAHNNVPPVIFFYIHRRKD